MACPKRLLLIVLIAAFAMPSATAYAISPAHVTAVADGTHVLKHFTQRPSSGLQRWLTGTGEISCDTYTAIGTTKLTNTAPRMVTSDVTYRSHGFSEEGPCEAFGLEATVDFNGCYYDFDMGTYEGESMSTGTIDIVCPPAKSISIKAPTCTITIPAQQGLGPVTYFGEESGALLLSLELSGMQYSAVGATCNEKGTNGQYEGDITVTAEDLEKGTAAALKVVGT